MFSPGIEPGTFCVLDRCDNRYTTKTSYKNGLHFCYKTILLHIFGHHKNLKRPFLDIWTLKNKNKKLLVQDREQSTCHDVTNSVISSTDFGNKWLLLEHGDTSLTFFDMFLHSSSWNVMERVKSANLKKQNVKLRLFSHFLIWFNPIRQINTLNPFWQIQWIFVSYSYGRNNLWEFPYMSLVYIEINISNPNSNTDHQIINLVVIRRSRLFAQSLPTL